MEPISANRNAARVAIIELRCLLVADAPIATNRRKRLLRAAAALIVDKASADRFLSTMETLLQRRFARDPDTFEVSSSTKRMLRLLDGIQRNIEQ